MATLHWFLAKFIVTHSAHKLGELKQTAATSQPWLQAGRGVLLIEQICIAVLGFRRVGLGQFYVIFASYPLMVMALSVPFLGETVGRWRWLDADCEFASALVVLQSGTSAFGSNTVIPL